MIHWVMQKLLPQFFYTYACVYVVTSNGQWMEKVKETFCDTLLTERQLSTDSKLDVSNLLVMSV